MCCLIKLCSLSGSASDLSNYKQTNKRGYIKAAYSVTMNIFRNFYFLFKTFVKVELSYVFTIKMFSTAENCTEK